MSGAIRQAGKDGGEQPVLDLFRDSMRHLAATVHLVTTRHGDKDYGIVATAVCSLSFDPPSLLVCINQASSVHVPICESERFCINVLGVDNRAVADHFTACRGSEKRFDVGDWQDFDGLPALGEAQSNILCDVRDRAVFGTHSIFMGEVAALRHREGSDPLLYRNMAYGALAEGRG